MLRNLITGAKYRSENTGQMTNLNIATPADSNDTNFSSSDILLAKDTVKIIDDKIANKKSFKFVETLPSKIEDVDPNVIYIVTGDNTNMKNVEIINTYSTAGLGSAVSNVNKNNEFYEYVFNMYENKRLYYEQLGKSNKLPLMKGNNETSVAMIQSTANGDFSTALGIGCTTNNMGECAVGQFNRSTESDDFSKQTLFSVGNGWQGFKNNAFEVKANGDVYIGYGSLDPDGGMASFKLQEAISSIEELRNKIYNMFEFVTKLPNVRDAETGKIYCIKDSKSTDNQNVYIEYALVEGEDGDYHFEKLGLFNAKPDLSGYAKLSGAYFSGEIKSNVCLRDTPYIWTTEQSFNKVPNTKGTISNIGEEESFIFTLEDGSTVTKSIRVISTTSQAGA